MIGAASVTEGDLVARFEACTLPPWAFGHREHLFVAWTYLKSAPFEDAAPRFVRNVKRFAARHGAQGKYHATVTWALLALMAEAIDALPSHSFDALLDARPELVAARETLRARYSREVLESERARRVPILPR
ncbi:MAG TPA: hypothetical protein VGH28_07175 [Polyangiaceae bacterium]|jgi:hypothetical protein